jgi:hypothetical protein
MLQLPWIPERPGLITSLRQEIKVPIETVETCRIGTPPNEDNDL